MLINAENNKEEDEKTEEEQDTKIEKETSKKIKKNIKDNKKEVTEQSLFLKLMNNKIFSILLPIVIVVLIFKFTPLKTILVGNSNISTTKNSEVVKPTTKANNDTPKVDVEKENKSNSNIVEEDVENKENFSNKAKKLESTNRISDEVYNANIKIKELLDFAKESNTSMMLDNTNKFKFTLKSKIYSVNSNFTKFGKISSIDLHCLANKLPFFRINIINNLDNNFNFNFDIPLKVNKKITFTFDSFSIFDLDTREEILLFEDESMLHNNFKLINIDELNNQHLKFHFKCKDIDTIINALDGEELQANG